MDVKYHFLPIVLLKKKIIVITQINTTNTQNNQNINKTRLMKYKNFCVKITFIIIRTASLPHHCLTKTALNVLWGRREVGEEAGEESKKRIERDAKSERWVKRKNTQSKKEKKRRRSRDG